MKKAVFLGLALFTYYLAGMYRSMALLVFCVGEFMLLVFLFVLPRYFQGKLSVSFFEPNTYTDRGREMPCRILVQNKSRMPISRFELRMRIRYFREKKYDRMKLYGSAARGESRLTFHLTGEYCGMAQVRIDRLRIYDYFLLFGANRALKEEMKIAVFPEEEALSVRLSDFGRDTTMPVEESTSDRRGDDFNEIRRIREYQNGDPKRYIHWNLSAKTDSVWIKEFERQTDARVSVLIDGKGFLSATVMEMSAFYRVLSALVFGFLREDLSVRVHWYEPGRGCFDSMDVRDGGQCREMLLKLYQAFLLSEDMNTEEAVVYENQRFYGESFRLTLEPALYKGDEPVYRFSPEKLDSEIQGTVLVL